ncbi:hypothetical protein [Hugenholtzia roseola]|uniref:hypothetical protein n=1 Tax=Hugenholtzia roseola TaxID=1002 RepID=UPI0003FED239|nr:hypothetical protein [Hugenholtzia roseola]
MNLALDAYYSPQKARVAGVFFRHWEDSTPYAIETLDFFFENTHNPIAEYESGAFFKRELPLLLAFVQKYLQNFEETTQKLQYQNQDLETLLIDGYVFLNQDGKKGLGAYFYEALQARVPVIGVAKRSFLENQQGVARVLRGKSQNPLFVSAIGLPLSQAANHLSQMEGAYRIPTLLKRVDSESRQ